MMIVLVRTTMMMMMMMMMTMLTMLTMITSTKPVNGVPAANWHGTVTQERVFPMSISNLHSLFTFWQEGGLFASAINNVENRCRRPNHVSWRWGHFRKDIDDLMAEMHLMHSIVYCKSNGQVPLQAVIVRSFFDRNFSNLLWFERPPKSSRRWMIGWSIRQSWVLASHMASLKAELQWF